MLSWVEHKKCWSRVYSGITTATVWESVPSDVCPVFHTIWSETSLSVCRNFWSLAYQRVSSKEHAKIKPFTVHLILFSLIILVTFHLCIFLLCSVSILPWYLIDIHTKFRNGGLVGGFAISSDGCFYRWYSAYYFEAMVHQILIGLLHFWKIFQTWLFRITPTVFIRSNWNIVDS